MSKSPPWSTKFLITLWNAEPLYPNPFSPVATHQDTGWHYVLVNKSAAILLRFQRILHPMLIPWHIALPRATKFAVVLGTMLPNRPITTLPTGLPPAARSKYTLSVTVVVTSGSAL